MSEENTRPPLSEDEEDASSILGDENDLPEDQGEYDASELLEDELTGEDNCDFKTLELLDESEESDNGSQIVGKSASIHTSNYITKFEKTRILGWRSQQIKTGAPPMIQPDEKINGKYVFPGGKYPLETYDIAKAELIYGRCPIIIGRRLPNGEKILLRASSLKL